MESNKKTNAKSGFYNFIDKKYKESFGISTRFITYWILFGLIEYGFLTDAQKEHGIWSSIFWSFLMVFGLFFIKFLSFHKKLKTLNKQHIENSNELEPNETNRAYYKRMFEKKHPYLDALTNFVGYWLFIGLIKYGFLTDIQKEHEVWSTILFSGLIALGLSVGKLAINHYRFSSNSAE